MKNTIIFSTVVIFALLAVIWVYVSETADLRRTQQAEIDHLKKENLKQKDSLESVLKVTQDSLETAFETIKQANIERQAAHERSQKTIRDLQRIVFIQHTDSSRLATLKQLYPTFKPN